MRNRYVVRARVSEAVFRKFLRHVAADLTAVQISQLTGLNRNTVNRLLACLRERMAEACELKKPLRGSAKVGKSYFGPRRVTGEAVRGAGARTPGFGVFKRHVEVYTEVVRDCKTSTLPAPIRGNANIRGVVHSDGWAGCDGQVAIGYRTPPRVGRSANEFGGRRVRGNDINGIAGFCGYAKTRMARFRGMHPHTFLFHLKESEFRFNHRGQDLYHVLLKLCRENPLS